MNPYTRTGRRQIARRARQYGHYRDGLTVWVYCPLCRERVNASLTYGITVVRALDAAIDDHLAGYCESVHGDTTIGDPYRPDGAA